MEGFDDLSFGFDLEFSGGGKRERQSIKSESIEVKTTHEIRRCVSESKLREILPAVLEKDTSYHIISGGDIDSMSFLKHVLYSQSTDYLLLSTWCMALEDIKQLDIFIKQKKIKRLDAYVGEIFPGTYLKEYEALKPVVAQTGGRVVVFRNHSKIFAGSGPDFKFVVESSANINTNPRTENTVITTNDALFDFYKDFFDGIQTFK